MLTPQFLLPIHRELVIDLFAGGGGASTIIEVPTGRVVRHHVKPPYQFLDELLHQCARLEGDLP